MLAVGTHAYGRIKTIHGIPVVTQFFMLQYFPIVPMQSYYLVAAGSTRTEGIPFVASGESARSSIIPLARLDWTSVLVAYLRAICASFVLAGSFIGIVCLVSSLSPNARPLDDFARYALYAAAVAFTIGTIGGIASYFAPLVSHRELEVRSICRLILGVAVDPGLMTREASEAFVEFAVNRTAGSELPALLGELRDFTVVRGGLAQGQDPARVDRMTEEMLVTLRSGLKTFREQLVARESNA